MKFGKMKGRLKELDEKYERSALTEEEMREYQYELKIWVENGR